MEKTTLSIPTISCEHCVMTIKKELGKIKGVEEVKGDPKTKEISIQWDSPATMEKIKSTLKEINYPAAD
ncbi:MAG: heavy-metal-associated domain-containing protein [Deltaproteobacteria bacterium]|nr:heavy-metal-associated domain-containing protein [Deltaproteobacteria bacterium]